VVRRWLPSPKKGWWWPGGLHKGTSSQVINGGAKQQILVLTGRGQKAWVFFPTRRRIEVLVYGDYGEQEACSATSFAFGFL